jgi:sugar phosphate isomerase/epimerase
MKLLFNIYGSLYTFGWLPEGAERRSAEAVIREAASRGFPGVELPAALVDLQDERHWIMLRDVAREHQLRMVLSTEGVDPGRLIRTLQAAGVMECAVVRTVVGGAKFGGDRREFIGTWKSFLETVRDRLARAVREAERQNIPLAVENHQDLTSEELVWLCETINSPWFGVTLDTANALSVVELPLAFAERIAPFIKHVHLKDYRIFLSESGYRLVRCPVGHGVIPFPELIGLLERHGRAEWASLEIGALEARHVRMLESDFWPEYPARPAAQVAEVMKFVLEHAQPTGQDYRTPHECGQAPRNVVEYEEKEWQASADYLRTLLGGAPREVKDVRIARRRAATRRGHTMSGVRGRR